MSNNPQVVDGLLLFSHGSLLCGAGQALSDHASRLLDSQVAPFVEIGYLNYSEPTFEVGVAKLVASGANRITIVPYFLVPGYFVTKSLPEQLAGIKNRFPAVEFIVAEPLGQDNRLADALIESATDAKPIIAGSREVYAESARECRRREDCPLYGTEYCPAIANR